MIDRATLWIWGTDLVLLLLAYWLGRFHASITLQRRYLSELTQLLDEVKALRFKIDRQAELYAIAREAIRSERDARGGAK